MSQLVLLDRRAHVPSAQRLLAGGHGTKLIALTAEACEALDASRLPCESASVYAPSRALAAEDEAINEQVVALGGAIDTFLGTGGDGPGVLSGQGYALQYAVTLIATRAWLMRETIRRLKPRLVTVLDSGIDPWFAGDGYARNPWLGLVEELANELGIRLEVISCPDHERWQLLNAWQGILRRSLGAVNRLRSPGVLSSSSPSGFAARQAALDGLAGSRFLLVGRFEYDWAPVLEALRTRDDVTVFRLDGEWQGQREWTYAYRPRVRQLWRRRVDDLGVEPYRLKGQETGSTAERFEAWLREPPTPPTLSVLGMDLFPSVVTHLRQVALLSISLARHADEVSRRALDVTQPHAVCMTSLSWLSAKRLAFQCRQRGVPVVCYQHGGMYGTHVCPKNEQNEAAHAAYFLTYGEGVQPRERPVVPTRAVHVPLGSSRIERLRQGIVRRARRPSHVAPYQIVWIGEYSTANRHGSTFQVEDVERFRLQQRCLEILGHAPQLRVTYRPYARQETHEGTSPWLKRAGLRALVTDASRPIDQVLTRADVVITDTSSGTVWNEVLGCEVPLIVYCDPRQTRLMPQAMAELEQACRWCKTPEELLAVVRRLAEAPQEVLVELTRCDPRRFVRRYVLHEPDGRCLERVVRFLSLVRREGSAPARQREPSLPEQADARRAIAAVGLQISEGVS